MATEAYECSYYHLCAHMACSPGIEALGQLLHKIIILISGSCDDYFTVPHSMPFMYNSYKYPWFKITLW